VLISRGTFTGDRQSQKLTLNLPAPRGDMIVSFDIKAQKNLDGFAGDTAFPRYLEVACDPMPVYDDIDFNQRMYRDLKAYFGTKDFMPVSFYWRDMNREGKERIRVTLSIEGCQGVEIKNIRLVQAAPVAVREFEKGVVIGNPSFQSVEVDLQSVLPGMKSELYMIKAATPPTPKRQTEDTKTAAQMAEGRNGQKVARSKIVIPPLDGLFLVKK